MKIIGLLGGMSWESTMGYYRIINETVKERLGGLHSAEMVIYSVDFQDIEQLQHKGEWDRLTEIMVRCAQYIQKAGADFLLIATNTMHLMAEEIERKLPIPLLHIADATAEEIGNQGITTVGLLGTCFTMEKDFYRGRLIKKHGLNVLIPNREDRKLVHKVIYEELCQGIINKQSEREYHRIIDDLSNQGAQGIILGCTELSLLVKLDKAAVPLFDTMEIHACKAVDWALE